MSASLLSIVQAVCPRLGLPSPSVVIGNADQNVLQLKGLLEQIGDELALEYKWQVLRKASTWTSIANESQGTLTALCGAGFKAIVNGTFWNLTLRRPVFGPVDDQDWQILKAFQPGGPIYQYRIIADQILINPIPPAGQQFSLIWETNYWVATPLGVPLASTFTADNQLCLFPEDMIKVGLQAYYKRAKGLAYADDLDSFNRMIDLNKMRDGTKGTLSLDQPSQKLVPGIFVPAGNWPV